MFMNKKNYNHMVLIELDCIQNEIADKVAPAIRSYIDSHFVKDM